MGEEKVDIIKFVNDYASVLREHIRLDRIVLFGSYARGEATAESDLDLIVVSPDFGENIFNDSSLLYRCMPRHVFGVDALPRTPEDLAAVEPESFLAYALEESKVVYDGAVVAR